MFAVVVNFDIKEGQLQAFLPMMVANAKTSLETESGCLQFDVCTANENANRVFLYELYVDKAAFDQHLDSEHFRLFAEQSDNYIAAKDVEYYENVVQ